MGHLQVTRHIFEDTIQCESQNRIHETIIQRDLVVVQFPNGIHQMSKIWKYNIYIIILLLIDSLKSRIYHGNSKIFMFVVTLFLDRGVTSIAFGLVVVSSCMNILTRF